MTWGRRLFVGLGKAFGAAVRPFSGFWNSISGGPWGFGGGGLPWERDYRRLVGDGSGNSIVMACIQYMARTFPEAPPALWKVDTAGVRGRVSRHAMIRLLRFPTATPDRPGGHYSGVLLWMATLTSWVLDGNAYWLKVRSAAGRVVQLWYVPHWMMEPRWPLDGSEYISYYEYRVNGSILKVPVSEVVHFRHGLSPDNPRKGTSPLASVMREVYTDEEAARFSASILKNLGIPGVVLSPSATGSTPWRPSNDDAETVKAKFKATFGGDNRGDPMVMTGPTDVKQFGFSPHELDLSALRHLPEERVTAALGLPAAVVGLGAGLAQTKVGATMAQLRDQAWQSNLIPTQRLMAEEVQTQLLPDFTSDLESNEFGFDTSRVKILQEDQGKLADQWSTLVRSGIAKRSDARPIFNLPIGPEDDIYLPQPGVGGAPSGADSPAGGTNEEALQQQISDLQDQLAAAQSSKP